LKSFVLQITLPGDVMLASSFTSYLGVFNAYYRDYLWKEFWMNDLKARDIPLSLPASGTNTAGTNNNNNNAASSSSMILPCDPLYNNILANESTLATWQNEGSYFVRKWCYSYEF